VQGQQFGSQQQQQQQQQQSITTNQYHSGAMSDHVSEHY
jgi:hypothetical protein